MLITFSQAAFATDDQIFSTINGVLGPGREVTVAYGGGILEFVDLPDATQVEADAVRAALVAAFPYETFARAEPHPILTISPAAAAILWTNMPAALTEFLGLTIHRQGAALHKIEAVRLIVNVVVAGVAGSGLRAQWSEDNVAFNSFAGAADPQVLIDSAGMKKSAWFQVPASVRKDAVIRIVGGGGNAVIDPQFGAIVVEGR